MEPKELRKNINEIINNLSERGYSIRDARHIIMGAESKIRKMMEEVSRQNDAVALKEVIKATAVDDGIN